MKPNRPLIVILSTVALDAVGIGLIMPVLPGLLRDLVHSNDVTAHYGILLALYALMQFACAPVLGALSDRFGRRPVLLVSLAGAAVDYAIMATAPSRSWSCLLRVASECRRCKQCCPGRWMRNGRGSCKAHWRRAPA